MFSSSFWYILVVAQIIAIPTESTLHPSPLCQETQETDAYPSPCALVDSTVFIQHPWYEIGRTWIIRWIMKFTDPEFEFENKMVCVKAQYELQADGKNLTILNSAVDKSKNSVTSVKGTHHFTMSIVKD